MEVSPLEYAAQSGFTQPEFNFIEPVVFAAQGGDLSYHARAIRKFMGEQASIIIDKDSFSQVIYTTRNYTNQGAIAISTVAGTVDDSARELVCQRPSALPSVVGRQDIEVQLSLIGSSEQTIADLRRPGVRCLGQKAAMLQCELFFNENLPQIRRRSGQYRRESIGAVKEALQKNDPNWIAVGPHHAASELGGFILGPVQINPPGSVTSFYILQQEFDPSVLPEHSDRTEPRAVISLAHPEGKGEFAKCMELADSLGLRISRFIPFDIGDFTKHDKDVRRGGGIFELAHKTDSAIVAEFSARVAGLKDNTGFDGPFNVRKLGGFMWLPETDVDPLSLIPDDNEIPDTTINIDRFRHDLALITSKLQLALHAARGRDHDKILAQIDEITKLAEQARVPTIELTD